MVYNALNVDVIIAGDIVTGYAEGTMVSCSRNEDRVIPYTGTKGEYATAVNNNRTGTISITLQQGSPMNSRLQRAANNNEVFSISVVDVNDEGAFRAGGSEAMILVEAANERADVISSRTWDITVFDYSMVE